MFFFVDAFIQSTLSDNDKLKGGRGVPQGTEPFKARHVASCHEILIISIIKHRKEGLALKDNSFSKGDLISCDKDLPRCIGM